MFICVCIRSPSAPHMSLSLFLYLSVFPFYGSVSVSGMNSSSGTHGHNQRISSIMEDKTRFSLCFEPNVTRVTLTGMDHILCLLAPVGILTVVRNRINILLKNQCCPMSEPVFTFLFLSTDMDKMQPWTSAAFSFMCCCSRCPTTYFS